MKRIFMIAAILCSSLMVLQSCSPKGTATTSVKRGNITGTWLLSDVTYEGVPEANIKSFLGESGPASCFKGGIWTLTNSGNGSYTIPGGGNCTAKTQSIFWSASPADQTFQFKKLFEGDKAKNVTSGHRLLLSSADDNTLVIKSPVEYGSSPSYVVLHFTKAAK
ncbi:MAG TPA: lipocalin family protein [Pedobacter sp.]|nr:lipocalin family protein [Pedobacter sp.]